MIRQNNINELSLNILDALIIGGGSSGAAITSCLVSQGLKVGLIEKNDFASGTSQESSNLIWGGIKYLENYEFNLVRKLCLARNRLLKNLPHLVKEIRFYCLHEKKTKHSLKKLILGTWFYWLWGSFFTQKPKSFRLPGNLSLPLNSKSLDGIFEYSDAYLPENDARFVFSFVQQAYRKGALVANYLEFKKAHYNKQQNNWQVEVYDRIKRKKINLKTKILINSTGVTVDNINQKLGIKTLHHHNYSKGIHVIVKKLFPEKKILTFFSNDDRLFFAIPMGNRTCIGTTDTFIRKPIFKIEKKDIEFVLNNFNRLIQLKKPLSLKDVISYRVGVRALVQKKHQGLIRKKKLKTKNIQANLKNDWFDSSRKHVIEQNEKNYFSVFGGKLTDCLNLAEEIALKINRIKNQNPIINPWLQTLSNLDKKKYLAKFKQILKQDLSLQSLPLSKTKDWFEKLWNRYGKSLLEVLKEVIIIKPVFKEAIPNCGYLEGEIIYQIKKEMVFKPDDILRRRTMLALIIRKKKLSSLKILEKINKIKG